MTPHGDSALDHGMRGDIVRWTGATIAVLAAHALVAMLLLRQPDAPDAEETSGAFVIELAPIPVARAAVPKDVAPGPDQVQAEAIQEKRETIEDAEKEPPPETPAPEPDVALPAPVPQKAEPVETQSAPQQAVAATTAAQVDTEKAAERAAAPVIGAPSMSTSNAVPNWQRKLVTAIERNKRYPANAQGRGEHGEAHVSFTIDRQGRLLSSRLVRGTGSQSLDDEALALLRRAQPFPPPPAEMPGTEWVLAVPIRFNIR